jgi:hypothetical protein
MEVVAITISVLALGVSIFFALRQDSLQRRLTSIEEARREEEVLRQRKADVYCGIHSDAQQQW